MPFPLDRNHFVGQHRYRPLVGARSASRTDPSPATGPCLVPPQFPHDLKRRPELAGEHLVYQALAGALPANWSVYYNCLPIWSRRKIDFCVLAPRRGLIVIEVKGGHVHVRRGSFRQSARKKASRLSKRIEPFQQVKRALEELWATTGIAPGRIPTFIMAAFPHMSESAYPWARTQHLLTREDLEPERLAARLEAALPDSRAPMPALEALTRKRVGDGQGAV